MMLVEQAAHLCKTLHHSCQFHQVTIPGSINGFNLSGAFKIQYLARFIIKFFGPFRGRTDTYQTKFTKL